MTAALRPRAARARPRRTSPRGGYHLWLRLPDGTDETALTAAALRAASRSPPAARTSRRTPAPHLRLSFAAGAESEITEGVRRLRTACEEVLPERATTSRGRRLTIAACRFG